jgi:methyl-accepting chemotaxis protein
LFGQRSSWSEPYRYCKGAQETGESSSRMFASAQALSGESLRLKSEVEKFLDGVRAA